VVFWAGIFAVALRVLSYFQKVEDFGDILAFKLLSMVLLTFFSLLVFSSVLTTLSKLYLSRDLSLVHAMPVSRETIFLARWIEATVDSSWMVAVYTIPVFLSYGLVYSADFLYYAGLPLVLLPLCITASGVSALLVMLAVVMLPASRVRSIFAFLGLVVLVLLYVTFRMLRPERLVDPEAFTTVMVYLRNMSTPSSPFLPSTWAYDALRAGLYGRGSEAIYHTGLAWSASVFLMFLNMTVAGRLYFRGFSKTQAALIRLISTRSRRLNRLFGFLSGPVRAFVIKELRTFWRDQTQWSQIFLVTALIVIYLYNFSVLPLEKSPVRTVYLQNLFAFLNMGLAAFVLTAIAARFAFPSVSLEGAAFWIVRSGPIAIGTFLWIKYCIYLTPLLVLAEVLVVCTNILLQVTPFMMGLSVATLLLVTPGVIALGIGMGAAYPDFSTENPAQSVTSFGGLVFMILSAAYIGGVIVLEAGPVYTLFMADLKGFSLSPLQWVWTVLSFAVVLVLAVLAVVLPMRFGTRRLEAMAQQRDAVSVPGSSA
jgi:ABC-2 type transport system permease protein